jgi:hypothetical protein
VRTEFGHLIKLVEVKTDEYASLDGMRSEITERLRRQSADESTVKFGNWTNLRSNHLMGSISSHKAAA